MPRAAHPRQAPLIIPARRGGRPALEALRAGAGTEGCRRARVVSVHRRAVNLRLEATGVVVAVLPEGSPVHPWALSADIDPALLAEGMEATVAGPVLAVGSLQIDLDGVEALELRLERRPRAVGAVILDRLAAGCSASRLGPPGPFDSALRAALDRFRDGGDPRELPELLGLGPGLTPSGDDMLVGILAGLDAAQGVSPTAATDRRALSEALGRGTEIEQRTSALSAQMIRAALEDRYAEPLLAVLHTLSEGAGFPESSRQLALLELVRVGHRSGADTLCGLEAALRRALGAP